jgi:hypothetical protein
MLILDNKYWNLLSAGSSEADGLPGGKDKARRRLLEGPRQYLRKSYNTSLDY